MSTTTTQRIADGLAGPGHFIVRGSHGNLVCNQYGVVIPSLSDYDGDGYRDIECFDLPRFRMMYVARNLTPPTEGDILSLGYSTVLGDIVEPEPEWILDLIAHLDALAQET
jgi:hypothetical protein